jgi:anti-anti-sigma factor
MTMSAMPQGCSDHLQVSRHGEVLVLTFTDLELAGDDVVHALRTDLLAAVAQAGATKVVLDLQHVHYLGSAMFRPFLNLKQRLEEQGGRLVLCGLGPMLLEVFRVTRLVSTSPSTPGVFTCEADVVAALAHLAG